MFEENDFYKDFKCDKCNTHLYIDEVGFLGDKADYEAILKEQEITPVCHEHLEFICLCKKCNEIKE